MDRLRMYDSIQQHLEGGGKVVVATYTKATIYSQKHKDWFSMDKAGSCYVRRGKSRDCIDFCAIRFV